MLLTWVERKTIVYPLDELPYDDAGKLAIIDVSKVRVQVPGYVYPVDIGAWCYTARKKPYRDTNTEKCAVNVVQLDSFRKARKDFVRRYLEYLSGYLSLGKSPKSLLTGVSQFATFIKWCDCNMPHVLDNHKHISKAVSHFSEEQIHKARASEININTAAALQMVAMTALSIMYGDKNKALFEGVRRVSRSYEATKVTESPNEDNAKFALNTYLNIFHQLTDFIVNFVQYPIELRLPHQSYWCFPKAIPFKINNKHDSEEVLARNYFAYNYVDGRLNSVDEIYQKMAWTAKPPAMRHAEKILEKANQDMSLANSNKFHHQRILCATLASQSFLMLFSANTGMGLGQISTLKWDGDEFDIVRERQGFKTIKYRANGKAVTFLISSSFVELFKKYLKLRRYLLDCHPGQGCEYLFFRISFGKIRPISMDMSTHFNMRLKRLFDLDINITTRQWRAHKSDWLIRNTDVATTAMVLQNNPETVLKHYVAGSEKSASLELTAYFEEFNKKLVIDSTESSKSISIGQCKSADSPQPLALISKFSPDCKKPEGCLFCEHYAVHADEVDLKKLLSFKYVIEQTRPLAASNEHYQDLYNPVISRIENAIDEINSSKFITENMQKRVKQEIYEFELLDQFWARKLQMLVDLELI